jgi:transcriptional regulator of acetoin/glycerol metabolism
VAQFEKNYLTKLLVKSNGNISLASRLSGKDRSDISKLIRKHGLLPQSFAATA